MKTLLLLRHAKSSWNDSSLEDWQRPLNKRGRRDAPRMGKLLKEEGLVPDVIVTSDAVRAQTTAIAVAEAAGYARDLVVEPLLYHATPKDIVAVLRTLPKHAQVAVIVGHNPGLEELLEQLTSEHHDLPTSALAQLAVAIDTWREIDLSASATLEGLWRPKELTK